MLKIYIPDGEVFDDSTQTFKKVKRCTLVLEHSLLSVSKWEAKWEKPFLGKEEKTTIETRDYVRCMTVNGRVPDIAYERLTSKDYEKISEYVGSSMTATTFSIRTQKSASREVITSELIYYWMLSQQIPFSCEKWHLNRLLTLIKICSIKNAPSKKMSKNSIMSRNSKLNAARRKKMNTKG